jgi:hypothetical protein
LGGLKDEFDAKGTLYISRRKLQKEVRVKLPALASIG